jgi:hypothetical protein
MGLPVTRYPPVPPGKSMVLFGTNVKERRKLQCTVPVGYASFPPTGAAVDVTLVRAIGWRLRRIYLFAAAGANQSANAFDDTLSTLSRRPPSATCQGGAGLFRLSGALHVALRLDDPAIVDPHEIDTTHRA